MSCCGCCITDINYADPGGSFPPDTPPDLGTAGSDTANPDDAANISLIDGSTTDGTLQVGGEQIDNPDGSATLVQPDGTQSWVAPDGTVYPNVVTSSDGSVVQFSDGSVMDTNTGKQYNSFADFINDPASGGTQNNGAASTPSMGTPGGGMGGGSKPSAAAKPDPAIAAALAAMTKLGSGLASLLSGQSKTVATKTPTVSSFGSSMLGGVGGFSTVLVLAGIGLIIMLGHKGGG